MKISKELLKKINNLLNDNEELKEKVLLGDVEAIRQIARISQKGIEPEEVVLAYESKDSDKMKHLYERSKKLLELQKIYKELCATYYKQKMDEGR